MESPLHLAADGWSPVWDQESRWGHHQMQHWPLALLLSASASCGMGPAIEQIVCMESVPAPHSIGR